MYYGTRDILLESKSMNLREESMSGQDLWVWWIAMTYCSSIRRNPGFIFTRSGFAFRLECFRGFMAKQNSSIAYACICKMTCFISFIYWKRHVEWVPMRYIPQERMEVGSLYALRHPSRSFWRTMDVGGYLQVLGYPCGNTIAQGDHGRWTIHQYVSKKLTVPW